MIAACKLLTNHIHTQLLRHSWQLPMYYWQKQNESFPVDTRFPDLLQQGKGAEMVFQLMPSEINWSWGHKLPFLKSGSFQSTQKFCLLVTLCGSCFVFERDNLGKSGIFKERFWWAQEHEVGSDHRPLFSLSWFTSVFLCVPAAAIGFSSCDPVTCTGHKVSAIVTLSYWKHKINFRHCFSLSWAEEPCFLP